MSNQDDFANKTRMIKRPGASGGPPPRRGYDDKTDIIGRQERSYEGHRQEPTNSGETRMIARPKPAVPGTEVVGRDALQGASADDALNDPVVGWLVIVAGPGRGNALPIFYGQNSIGRESDQRVALTYGDKQISRDNHCTIIYEPTEREFYVVKGNAKGLSYLNGKVILESRPIHSGELLRIGVTTLRFVAFCGPAFDWQDGPLVAPQSNPPTPPPVRP